MSKEWIVKTYKKKAESKNDRDETRVYITNGSIAWEPNEPYHGQVDDAERFVKALVSRVAATTGGSEVKHTPGPWKAKQVFCTPKDKTGCWVVTASDGTQMFMKVGERAQADAELIARAPKLETELMLSRESVRVLMRQNLKAKEELALLKSEKAQNIELQKESRKKRKEQFRQLEGELAALKALAGKVIAAKDHPDMGLQSANDCLVHDAIEELRAALADKGGLNQ